MRKHKDISGNKITHHHIIPSSRGGEYTSHNICRVIHKLHDLYHRLFSNLTPEEIVEYLNKTFWNDNYEITITEK